MDIEEYIEELEYQLKVTKAFKAGKQIQVKKKYGNTWVDTNPPLWNWEDCDYREKPTPPKFRVEGNYFIDVAGKVYLHTHLEESELSLYYNLWKDRKSAESALQRVIKINFMLNFISRHQTIGEGNYYIYKYGGIWEYGDMMGDSYNPDSQLMHKQTAKILCAYLNEGGESPL